MKLFRYSGYISFVILGILTVILVVASIVDNLSGPDKALRDFYESPVTVTLWILLVIFSLVCLFRRISRISYVTLGIHLSLVLILAGAMVTFIWGERGTVRLYEDKTPESFISVSETDSINLPFDVSLSDCGADLYPGSMMPSNYYSDIVIRDAGKNIKGKTELNKPYLYRNYRFYQTSIGEDYSVLTVYHDPWGIVLSYAGYFLLFVTMTVLLFCKKSRFHTLWKSLVMILLFVSPSFTASAQSLVPEQAKPQVLQQPLARSFGRMYVYWNGRVAPVSTMAREFCLKIYGKDSYKGFSAEQVLTGWLFYYDSWKNEPMVKIKGDLVKDALSIDGKYASLKDFYDRGGYKLDRISAEGGDAADVLSANEKVDLIAGVCTGSLWKIFPVEDNSGINWISWIGDEESANRLPAEASGYMENIARDIATGHFRAANSEILNIRNYQESFRDRNALPDQTATAAENIYNSLPSLLYIVIVTFAVGFAGFFCMLISNGEPKLKTLTGKVYLVFRILTVVLFLYISMLLALRWIVGGHIPLSNGYETMLSMGWLAIIFSILAHGRLKILSPLAMLVAALAMMVAVMGESNPAIGKMTPVLNSPLLSVHVLLVMCAYSLFALIFIIALFNLYHYRDEKINRTLSLLSDFLLYPAEFFLGAGIFVGAIWANVSWGRYWGWDPKETWALISFIVYSLPLHVRLFPRLGSRKFLNVYYIFAFLSILFTYFGVNFMLGGLHSYA